MFSLHFGFSLVRAMTLDTFYLIYVLYLITIQKNLRGYGMCLLSMNSTYIAQFTRSCVQCNIYMLSSNTIFVTLRPPMLMGYPRLLTRSMGLNMFDGKCVNLFKTQKSCLLTLQSPSDISSCFGITRTVSRITSR